MLNGHENNFWTLRKVSSVRNLSIYKSMEKKILVQGMVLFTPTLGWTLVVSIIENAHFFPESISEEDNAELME